MQIVSNPQLSPTSCLDIDSAAAKELTWLPYAVRFKLDECGLGMSLRDWQMLPQAERVALVHAPLAPGRVGFEHLAMACGARTAACRQRAATTTLDASEIECLPGVDPEQWRACATPFARYVLRKIAHRKEVHEAT